MISDNPKSPNAPHFLSVKGSMHPLIIKLAPFDWLRHTSMIQKSSNPIVKTARLGKILHSLHGNCNPNSDIFFFFFTSKAILHMIKTYFCKKRYAIKLDMNGHDDHDLAVDINISNMAHSFIHSFFSYSDDDIGRS